MWRPALGIFSDTLLLNARPWIIQHIDFINFPQGHNYGKLLHTTLLELSEAGQGSQSMP